MSAPASMFPFLYQGSPEFIAQVQGALATLYGTRTGQVLVKAIADSKHKVTIAPTEDANAYCRPDDAGEAAQLGRGTNSTIYWNPQHRMIGINDAPGSIVTLGSQLVQALHNALGTRGAERQGAADVRPTGTLYPQRERAAIGLGAVLIINPLGRRIDVSDYSSEFPSENSLRDELKVPRRAHYYPLNWPGGPPW